MLKKLVTCIAMIAGTGFAAHQIDLAGPKDVTMASGWTSWITELPQPIAANPFKVVYWMLGSCRVIPMTNIAVRYRSIPYWSSTEWKDGAYYGDGDEEIVAVKVDMYQTQVESQTCVVKVSGFIP